MTHLSTVVDSSIKIFEETFNKRGVEIKTEMDSNVPEVLIDPSMMTQVIMNLVKNAVEAMDSEKSSDKKHFLKIKLTSNELIGVPAAIVEVTDNGPGIPEDVKEKVFDFGFSTKGAGISRGYGLHSCMETIKKYDGTLVVESELGKGTTFRITIPVAPSETLI
jgi:signal transduction histidine kinase